MPWPQKGPSVNLPLGSSAPVKSGGNSVSNAIDLQSSAGGFTRLNLGAAVPLNVTNLLLDSSGTWTISLTASNSYGSSTASHTINTSIDRKSTRLNSSHRSLSRMPSSA